MKMNDLYEMIFKRKSMRKFDRNLLVSIEELKILEAKLKEIKPLTDDIKVQFVIVERKQTTAKRGEYCLLMYSEEKPLHLQNAGYMLEQIDLFLTSLNIGVCWYGVTKPKDMQYEGLKYVIMLAFGKCRPADFRNDISEFKRKPLSKIWQGDYFLDLAKVVRIAPSGCNLQPWRIFCSNREIKVCKDSDKKSFPEKKLAFYAETDFSLIDMGICLCYLEICFSKHSYCYERKLYDEKKSNSEILDIADYKIIIKTGSQQRAVKPVQAHLNGKYKLPYYAFKQNSKNLPLDTDTSKYLNKLTTSELGRLFPIIIKDYSDKWPDLYTSEEKLITDSFSQTEIVRIDHIGSTAIPGLKAKPTIDILLQVTKQIDIQKLKDTFKSFGYLINVHPENPAPHLTFVKGYTNQGFKGQAYHVHIRYHGDWNEIGFRDYLIKHKEVAKEYETLKLKLAEKYPNDREAYTNSKTKWIEKINNLT